MTFHRPVSRRPLQELVQIESESACSTSTACGIAGDKVALAHEALGAMYADCLHYQVDLHWLEATPTWHVIGPQGVSRSRTRVSGTTSLKPGLKLHRLRTCASQKVLHVSANSLCLLKQYEDALGGAPYEECIAPDWSTFPGLDPLVASVFEWGHSMDDDTWANIPSGQPEFKVNVSEWVLNSTSASYLLNDRDHTPLLIEVHANHFSRSRTKEMNHNPDTLKEAADRRKQRQKMKKARGSDDLSAAPTDPRSSQEEASSGAPSSGSQRPTEMLQRARTNPSRTRTTSRWQESSKGKSKDKSKGKSKGKN